LTIPEVRYSDIFPDSSASSTKMYEATVMRVLDDLLHDSSPGIIRVIDLPAANIDDERDKVNTLVTRVLKQLFGSVFVHPRRGVDKTFNIASHHEDDVKRATGLPNYDTNKVLLPHCDHAHYDTPAHVMGLYGLEGESENTYVSGHAVLATLREEAPELFDKLCKAPIGIGRVAPFYDPPMYQATVDTAVTMHPGFPDKVKRFRWHPHLSGSLLSTFDDFHSARAAHQKFQEIMRRDTHQLKLPLNPGDLYIWDNFRLLHGRERVLKVPRTSVGQTVPEQVVSSRYRDLKIAQLKQYMDQRWLVQVPMAQLNDLLALVNSERTSPGQV
jgi:trimethyllysine dioxygenase